MGKLLVVTGGSKGIGKAIIKKFVANGFDIITCARNLKDLEVLKTEISKEFGGVSIHIFQADLSKKNEVESFIKFVKSKSSKVDVLINNAGVFVPGQTHKEEEGALENQIETNLYSAYYVTRGLISEMVQNKDGHIFNMCSTASITPYINGGSYCISKYALYGFTKVLREEMKEHNIKVTAVLPGATFTPSWEGAGLPAERFIKPEDVAESIYSVCSLSKNAVVEELLIRPQLGDIV